MEKTPAAQDGFPTSLIEGGDNLVLNSRLKHWEITSWYATKNPKYGDLSPRDYLRDKDWEFRWQFGLDVLIEHGVLRP